MKELIAVEAALFSAGRPLDPTEAAESTGLSRNKALGALEDARNVENERKARLERRRQLKEAQESVLSEVAEKLSDKLHLDDPTQYKEKVWQRINEFNGKPIPIGDLLDRPEKASVVRTFVGSLFLAREGRIDIIQKELDSHNIYVKNLENAG